MEKNKNNKINRRVFIKAGGMISAGLAALPVRGMAKSQNPEMNKKKNTNIFAVRYDTYPEADLPAELGMGFNWFEHLGSGGYYARWDRYPLSTGIYPEIDDDKGWGAIEKGLDELNPGWFRFGMPPDPHINNRGKFDGDTIHFRHLERLDNWATKNKRTILLDTFLIPRHYEYPLPDGINDPGSTIINMAAANNRKYAENFVAPMIDYVVNELKLKSVRYFNPVNEPMEYGVYQTPDNEPDAMVHYVEMYREIRRALEMGTFYYGKFHNPAGVASIDATITVAEGIIRAINTGVQAFCIWSLMNPNDVDGHWAVMGQKNGELIKYKYPFAVYRLISNHFLPGSKVYPVLRGWDSPEIVHVHATFLEAPNGDRTMLLVNDHPDDKQTAEFNLPEDWKDVASFDVSMVNRDILNKAQSRVDVINGRIRVECEAFSLLGLKAKARNY